MKILILNSDIPYNLGDRAILSGVIKLARQLYPGAEIWGISSHKQRDENWYGINFLKMAVQSLNPLDWLRLLKFARSCDLILWGGGEILKDYTNKLALFYWTIKIFLISWANPNIIGFFQGIGPTAAKFCQKIIACTVNQTKIFITRDLASKQKLINWGTRTKLIDSYDPAMLNEPQSLPGEVIGNLEREFGINQSWLDNFIGFGPRNWFHYKKGAWLPFRFKPGGQGRMTHHSVLLCKNLAKLGDFCIERFRTRIIFFPMHMSISEGDVAVCEKVVGFMEHKEKVAIINKDILAPHDSLNLIAMAKLFIGLRLHSAILATIAGVPTMSFYYVDKGREYFRQIGLADDALPIEDLIKSETLPKLQDSLVRLWHQPEDVKNKLAGTIQRIRVKIREDANSVKNLPSRQSIRN